MMMMYGSSWFECDFGEADLRLPSNFYTSQLEHDVIASGASFLMGVYP